MEHGIMPVLRTKNLDSKDFQEKMIWIQQNEYHNQTLGIFYMLTKFTILGEKYWSNAFDISSFNYILQLMFNFNSLQTKLQWS